MQPRIKKDFPIFTATKTVPKNTPFFPSSAPLQARAILSTYSYIQPIGFPAQTKFHIRRPFNRPKTNDLCQFWSAIRQFEIFKEGDNLAIDDLEIDDHKRAVSRVMPYLRAGGYRIAVFMIGLYSEDHKHDELSTVDEHLQEEIEKFINLLYLEKSSKAETEAQRQLLQRPETSCLDLFPHIALSRASSSILAKSNAKLQTSVEEESFFRLMDMLPTNNRYIDKGLGIAIPAAKKNKNWPYQPKPENSFLSFKQAIHCIFQNDTSDTPSHPRGYGDRMTEKTEAATRSDLKKLNKMLEDSAPRQTSRRRVQPQP